MSEDIRLEEPILCEICGKVCNRHFVRYIDGKVTLTICHECADAKNREEVEMKWKEKKMLKR